MISSMLSAIIVIVFLKITGLDKIISLCFEILGIFATHKDAVKPTVVSSRPANTTQYFGMSDKELETEREVARLMAERKKS